MSGWGSRAPGFLGFWFPFPLLVFFCSFSFPFHTPQIPTIVSRCVALRCIVSGCSWLLLVASGCFWLLLVVPCCSGLFGPSLVYAWLSLACGVLLQIFGVSGWGFRAPGFLVFLIPFSFTCVPLFLFLAFFIPPQIPIIVLRCVVLRCIVSGCSWLLLVVTGCFGLLLVVLCCTVLFWPVLA